MLVVFFSPFIWFFDFCFVPDLSKHHHHHHHQHYSPVRLSLFLSLIILILHRHTQTRDLFIFHSHHDNILSCVLVLDPISFRVEANRN